jgi:xanthine dehydrogenase accessory factor
MSPELLDLAADLARRGEPFAIATVVGRTPPTSAHVGDSAVVTPDAFHGWVGGSCTRPTVESEARRALADGRPRRIALDPDPAASRGDDVQVFPMTCHSGGRVEIHIQPVLPAPHLLVYGVAPTARALARLGKAMGYRVSAVDPTADASAFPGADTVATAPSELRTTKTTAPLLAVVATQGQWDEDALLAALAHEPDYVAVVASAKRFAEMRALLAGKAPEAALARVRNPAGLDLGAQRPEEIALSILAQFVKERPRPVRAQAAAPPTEEALDPVCGMTVRVAGATHRASHDGRDFFFCCGGCRERFLAEPQRYLVAGGAR